jgi:hypothetical protein
MCNVKRGIYEIAWTYTFLTEVTREGLNTIKRVYTENTQWNTAVISTDLTLKFVRLRFFLKFILQMTFVYIIEIQIYVTVWLIKTGTKTKILGQLTFTLTG